MDGADAADAKTMENDGDGGGSRACSIHHSRKAQRGGCRMLADNGLFTPLDLMPIFMYKPPIVMSRKEISVLN